MANSAELIRALNQMRRQERARTRLGVAGERPAIAARMGVGEASADDDTGIASPLSENARTYSATVQTITSADGLFSLDYAPVTDIAMVDAQGRVVDFVYTDE